MKYFWFILILFNVPLFGQKIVRLEEQSRISKGRIMASDTEEWFPWTELKQSNDSWKFFPKTSEIYWSDGTGKSYFYKRYHWTDFEETYQEPGFEGKKVVKFKCTPLDNLSAWYGQNLNFWIIFHDSTNIQLYVHNGNVKIISNVSISEQ